MLGAIFLAIIFEIGSPEELLAHGLNMGPIWLALKMISFIATHNLAQNLIEHGEQNG